MTHGEPLRQLPQLRVGDDVTVKTNDGDSLEVTNRGHLGARPRSGESRRGVQPAQDPGQILLTLVACAEVFHTDNRLIAFAELVDTQPRG